MNNKFFKKYFNLSLVFLVLIVFFSNCKKEQLNMLEGEWLMVGGPVVVLENQNYFFSFTKDKVYTGFEPIDVPQNRDTCGIGNYYLRNTVLTVDAIANECRGLTYHEDFVIKELTNDVLIIYQFDGGYRLYEFVKVKNNNN